MPYVTQSPCPTYKRKKGHPYWAALLGALQCLLFWNPAQVDFHGLGNAGAIGRIGLEAVADVADLDFVWRVAHGSGRVAEQGLLLLEAHDAKEFAWLGEVVGVVFAGVPVGGSAV